MNNIYAPTEENIKLAAETIKKGGLVAIPTDTVYGLGADVYNPKFRPRNYIEIEYLETAPSERHGSKTRHYKGCGDF